jgi:hypothetical protein
VWIGPKWLRKGCYEHDNEHSGSWKSGNLLTRWATVSFSRSRLRRVNSSSGDQHFSPDKVDAAVSSVCI